MARVPAGVGRGASAVAVVGRARVPGAVATVVSAEATGSFARAAVRGEGALAPIDEGKGPLTPPVSSRADTAVQHGASEVPARGQRSRTEARARPRPRPDRATRSAHQGDRARVLHAVVDHVQVTHGVRAQRAKLAVGELV